MPYVGFYAGGELRHTLLVPDTFPAVVSCGDRLYVRQEADGAYVYVAADPSYVVKLPRPATPDTHGENW